MNSPTKEQVLKAANTSVEARKALVELFPDYFAVNIKPGQIYTWGTESSGNSGVVVSDGLGEMSFVDFQTGHCWLSQLPVGTTSIELGHLLHNVHCISKIVAWDGRGIRGPRSLKSWCLK